MVHLLDWFLIPGARQQVGCCRPTDSRGGVRPWGNSGSFALKLPLAKKPSNARDHEEPCSEPSTVTVYRE